MGIRVTHLVNHHRTSTTSLTSQLVLVTASVISFFRLFSIVFYTASFHRVIYSVIPWCYIQRHSIVFYTASFHRVLYSVITLCSIQRHYIVFYTSSFHRVHRVLYSVITSCSIQRHSIVFYTASLYMNIDIYDIQV